MPKSVILPLKHLHDGTYGEIPKQENEAILHLADPMVQSFNYALSQGLQTAISNIPSVELTTPNDKIVALSIINVSFPKPIVSNELVVKDSRLFPKQCIESQTTYKSPCHVLIGCTIGGIRIPFIEVFIGYLPIMVKSNFCNLHGLNPQELLDRGEQVNDPGGYFIINGCKKVIRLLTAFRRNYPMAITRETWKKKQQFFTDKGLMLQCVAKDETSTTNILHYLTTGDARLEFFIYNIPYLVDLVMLMKVLKPVNDMEIVSTLSAMRPNDTFFYEKIKNMLQALSDRGLFTSVQCKQFIGSSFRNEMHIRNLVPSWYSDEQVCDMLVQNFILIHLPESEAKFDMLCFMACKLYAYVAGDTVTESLDVTSMMETHVSGAIYLKYFKEKLSDLLHNIKWQLFVKLKNEPVDYEVTEGDIRQLCNRSRRVCADIESFITTGSVSSKTGIGLSQSAGLTVILEGLNRMRDLSHLRAIHRGSYFMDMKTVAPRRLTGEAWGFICPVHTPDGAPCGLLNHLTYNCKIPAFPPADGRTLPNTLRKLGMVGSCLRSAVMYPVLLDGAVLGYLLQSDAQAIVTQLRALKTTNDIYQFTEIVLVPKRPFGGQYPGLYLFTTPARMMRPVINLKTKTIEFIGTFEQVYLNIAITLDQVDTKVHTHLEIDKTQIFSNIGKLVPFSDCNPNPRNMYQCQMGKQSVGTPLHTWQSQTLTKAFRLQYPQVPLVRNSHYDVIDMQDHCMGFNAVLAIISYTGYDIEDAMTINKSSMQRGLGHCQVYKTEYVSLRDLRQRYFSREISHVFARDPSKEVLRQFLDSYGMPVPGTLLVEGDPYYCIQDTRSKLYRVQYYKGEKCIVDKVAVMEINSNDDCVQKISITIRSQRYPNIGDKFASRSGQKGIMSRLYPTEDLPFSERGIVPDIIFNPHGIPSRMTAGKLLELIAGKAAAEYALSFDSTPFEFNDENPAADYFGSILEKAGFNYYGEDVMYSGVNGRMLEVKVYQGIMYYQRLKHMTEDKYQVRSTGAVDAVTRQPIKGRKRGGAIRFGEMERDALIAHGAAFSLKDRLLDCSDIAQEWACVDCGSLLTPIPTMKPGSKKMFSLPECRHCGPDSRMVRVEIPYAFKFMVAELASVGIATKLTMDDNSA